MEGETDVEYQRKKYDFKCIIEGNRNALLAGLVLSLGAYWYRVVKAQKQDILSDLFKHGRIKTGGVVESMDSNEPDLYKGGWGGWWMI